MKKERKPFDRIPEEFASCEEAGGFWDTHDTMVYPEAFSDADIDIHLEGRKFEIDIEEDVMVVLRREAGKLHLQPGLLASRLLRKELSSAG
jgi:hypothetical protein